MRDHLSPRIPDKPGQHRGRPFQGKNPGSYPEVPNDAEEGKGWRFIKNQVEKTVQKKQKFKVFSPFLWNKVQNSEILRILIS